MHKIRRKPPPPVELDVALDVRYPTPDPNDPFAPLWVLRSRNSTNDLKRLYSPPAVAFPVIHDRVSTPSDTTDASHHPKWHNRLLRRVRVPASPSTSTSTASSFVHVSVPDDTEWSLPTPAQLARVASLPVVAASGLRVPFASLFVARPTIVVFIRHFWCPHCQDYVSSISQTALHSAKSPVDLVLIGNGAPAFIPKYRALFGLEFEIYTDPTLAVYAELGMGRCSSSAIGGIAKVVLRTLKAGLPVWHRGGDVHQLGGEFVLGPGLTCTYAHRMQSPKGHIPIRTVLSAAGVDVPPAPATPPKLLASLRIKSWTPQRRSRSLCTNPRTPNSSDRRKNMSTGTHPILGSPTNARAASPSPVNEFGAWRNTGHVRVSFDSSRVLSKGAARRESHSTFPYPYTASPYQRHRQYASTTTLPMPISKPMYTQGETEEEEEVAWSPRSLLPPEDEDEWMRVRLASLEAIKARKRERRAGVGSPGLGVGATATAAAAAALTVAWEPLDETEETEEEVGACGDA